MLGSLFSSISEEEFTQKVTLLLEDTNVPGVSLAVRNGDQFATYQLGVSKGESVLNDDTYCYGASLTKPLFAFVCLRLVEEEILNLDTPIMQQTRVPHYDHLPYADHITPRHVLSHTPGLPNWAWNRELVQEFEPGTTWQYSGEGYLLLQKCVQQLSRRSFWQLLQEYLMQPAGITRMALSKEDLLDENHVEGHDQDGKLLVPPNHKMDEETQARIDIRYNAAGSLWTTPLAYTRALYFIQTDYPNIWDLMTSQQIYHEPWRTGWGVGIGLEETGRGKAAWQWGSEQAIKDFTISYLDHDFAIHVFTHGSNGKEVYTKILQMLTETIPNYLKYATNSR